MKKIVISSLVMGVILVGCNSMEQKAKTDSVENPFFTEYTTPFGAVPFDKVKDEHYLPAYEKAIAEQNADIQAIVDNSAAPTFENTIEAMEKSGKLLRNVGNAFNIVTGAHTNKNIQATEEKTSSMLIKLNDDINLNTALFKKVKAVYDSKASLTLRADQQTLLEKTYKGFIRGGANLNDEDKQIFRKYNDRLTKLSLKFKSNVLSENNTFEMVVDNKDDLAGLPQGIIDAAAATATQRGHEGKWVFTTHRPSSTPFLTYAKNRKLRETIFKGYIQRGDNDDANDNKKNCS